MNNDLNYIQQAVRLSGLHGFTGRYHELGGGEVNDSFVLDCGGQHVVMRLARYPEVRMLHQEAEALKLLDIAGAPKLIYFNEEQRIDGRLWILESFIEGHGISRLNVAQYNELGTLLAQIHAVQESETTPVDFWFYLLDACKNFGDEAFLLAHPDERLRRLVVQAKAYFATSEAANGPLRKSLIHGDATPSNVLVTPDGLALIDWEFAKFKDPMADFSTIYYDDMEYNRGKWRVHITPEERTALFDGYHRAGGIIEEGRLGVWMLLDKLGAAIFLYWKVHQSGHASKTERLEQYEFDFNNLLNSLETNLLDSK